MRVEVHNFMTYKHAVIEPGPKLNLVLGPNGTGKSSLVCAISIGLGGRTNLLGRAEDLQDYVRRGDDVHGGWVEITLSSGNPMRPHVVRREIKKADNSSTWRLNGRDSRLKEVEELVRDKLKVQLDNLCQFLPQDKVVEFARMKPVDLLEATEKAIGNGELYEQHQQLVEARKELADQDAHKEALEASLAQLRSENERNQRDVESIQERERIMQEVALAKKKVPWQEYEETRNMWQEDKAKRDQAKQQLAELQRGVADNEGPLKERQAALRRLEAQRSALLAEIKAADAELVGQPAARGRPAVEGVEGNVIAAIDEVQSKREELEGLEQKAAEQERKKAELERSLAELEEQVAALPQAHETGELGVQRQQLMRKRQDVLVQASGVGVRLDDARANRDALGRQRSMAQEKLGRIDSAKMQRLRVLDQRHHGMINGWKWVQANKARFRGPVHGPVAVEVECPDPFHVQCLEQSIGGHVWGNFVTQHQSDQDLLRQVFKDQKWNLSVSNYNGDPNEPISHPNGEAAEYARYGITQTLDSVFVAPNVIKRVLCDEGGINRAYVGGQNTQVVALFRDCQRVQNVWTPEANNRRTRSNYNREAESFQVQTLNPARLLSGGASTEDGREREALLAEMKRCDEEMSTLNAELAELAREKAGKDEWTDRLSNEIREVETQIKRQQHRNVTMRTKLKSGQTQLERLRKLPDPRRQGARLREQMDAARQRAFELALELATLQAGQAGRLARFAEADLGAKEAAMQCERIKAACKQREEKLTRARRVVAEIEELCRQSRDDVRRMKEEAEKVAPLTDELNEAFANLPNSLEALKAFIDEKTADADAKLIANPAALRQYNERCRSIAEQEAELERVEETRQLARATIDGVKGRWLPELQRIVAHVNATFSANFQFVGVAGDVALHEAPGEDFEHYAIEIRVKFRDTEDMQTLDASRQSGGERSVSTIIYLIALQGVTVTPFRVVDEINQGMDPINERKVFMQLVDAACRPGTPQCFLLTPKLLPDLPMTRDVTVLQIMNGVHIKEVASRFTMEMLLGSRRTGVLAGA
ncbi:Structural maintenance of chromosomes 5 [Micractinium conductrix]|uniref:Structural maintenance of chromosomes protein 5 n=1 Tax=Micractinium conductrix TaxID=554055 RepID=A0A2P6VCN1_9CHLO|nr:Structural maintenance of chromosomes 5 [Micractinium conductrix]|eukprot:PSC71853.1 Structural maintenance of chromosomes 5 [Micractinium conductrix]